MRELRGCVHIDAVNEVGLSALEACYLQDPMLFALHGYVEDEAPDVTPDATAKKARAEELTSSMMSDCFSVLDDEERQHFADGASRCSPRCKRPSRSPSESIFDDAW